MTIRSFRGSSPSDLFSDQGAAFDVHRRLRFQRINRTVMAALFARAAHVLSLLLSVPVALAYLGSEQFGIWMALTGVLALLAFFDLGIGVGLQNRLTDCHGRRDAQSPKILISTALMLLLLSALLICLLSAWILPLLPLTGLFKIQTEAASAVLLPTAQVVLLIFAVGLPLGVIQRLLDAYQRGYAAQLLLGVGRLLSLASVYFCAWRGYPLPVLVGLYMAMPLLLIGLGGGYIFWRMPRFRPSVHALDRGCLSDLMHTGGLALGAQLAALIMGSGSLLVLTSQFGAAAIVPFAVTQRLMGVGGMVLALLLGPLWPAYGEARMIKDLHWIQDTFVGSLKITLALSLPIFILAILFGQDFVAFWTQSEEAVPDSSVLMACGVWFLILAWSRPTSMLLNGLSVFRGQALYGLAFSLLAVSVGYLAASQLAIASVIWIMVLLGEFPRAILLSAECTGLLSALRREPEYG